MMSTTTISPLAVVHPGAVIGEDVTISPFAIVEEGATVGNGVTIHPNAHIWGCAEIGEGSTVYNGASIGAPPQDLKYAGEPAVVVVGARTTIRECVTIHRGTTATGRTSVGNDCLLMAYSHVAHDCVVGNHVILANGVQLGGHARVDDWAIIGGLSGVHQFERVGAHAMIGACFRVMKDVPPFVLAGNQPLSFNGINVIGLRRRGFSDAAIESINETYRLLYRSGLNVSDAVERIRAEIVPNEHTNLILDFIAGSRRGIIPGARSD